MLLACSGPAAVHAPPPRLDPVAPSPKPSKSTATPVTPARPACDQPDLSGLSNAWTVIGAVCEAGTRAWLAGVTVILDRDGQTLTGMTDERGLFVFSMTPGDYGMTFYYSDITKQRPLHVSSTQSSLIVEALDLGQLSP